MDETTTPPRAEETVNPAECPSCRKPIEFLEEISGWARCRTCQAMVFRPSDGPRILIAHGSEEISASMGALLRTHGFSVFHAENGSRALDLLSALRPQALVVDAGLGDMLSFQLVEHLRNTEALRAIKVVLIASVYNQSAYRNHPTSLYGADDYVEQHHIQDKLPGKIQSLLGIHPKD